jgi:hypothetical protein
MHLPLTRAFFAPIVTFPRGKEVVMKTMLTRYMTWMLIAAATLLLFGLAQVPELWAPLT